MTKHVYLRKVISAGSTLKQFLTDFMTRRGISVLDCESLFYVKEAGFHFMADPLGLDEAASINLKKVLTQKAGLDEALFNDCIPLAVFCKVTSELLADPYIQHDPRVLASVDTYFQWADGVRRRSNGNAPSLHDVNIAPFSLLPDQKRENLLSRMAMKALQQPGRPQPAAMSFHHGAGELYMILDADLTPYPELYMQLIDRRLERILGSESAIERFNLMARQLFDFLGFPPSWLGS